MPNHSYDYDYEYWPVQTEKLPEVLENKYTLKNSHNVNLQPVNKSLFISDMPPEIPSDLIGEFFIFAGSGQINITLDPNILDIILSSPESAKIIGEAILKRYKTIKNPEVDDSPNPLSFDKWHIDLLKCLGQYNQITIPPHQITLHLAAKRLTKLNIISCEGDVFKMKDAVLADKIIVKYEAAIERWKNICKTITSRHLSIIKRLKDSSVLSWHTSSFYKKELDELIKLNVISSEGDNIYKIKDIVLADRILAEFKS